VNGAGTLSDGVQLVAAAATAPLVQNTGTGILSIN